MITTDQGKEFRNVLNKLLTDSFGIKSNHRLPSPGIGVSGGGAPTLLRTS